MIKKILKVVAVPFQVVIKSVIYAVGNIFLLCTRYDLTRVMFNHAIWGKGKEPTDKLNNLIVRQLTNSSVMNDALEEMLSNAEGDTISEDGVVELIKNDRINQDLFYSLQHIKFNVRGKKTDDCWDAVVSISDIYDFDVFRCAQKISFKNAANDLGFIMQRLGMMYPYSIGTSYRVKINTKKDKVKDLDAVS